MRRSSYASLKPQILALRGEGLSYAQIQERLGRKIPQSTLSNWCRSVELTKSQRASIRQRMVGNTHQYAAIKEQAKAKRENRRILVQKAAGPLLAVLNESEAAKIALLMLYLGEGRKNERGIVTFSNSNPGIIQLFLKLFRKTYEADLAKFRVTVQCRADQDIQKLEGFWREIIAMPGVRFYKAQVDARTRGKPTKSEGYMGVCCISYIDNKIQFELVNQGMLLCQVS